MKIEVKLEDLIIFLDSLLDKIEKCYHKESKQSIKRFLERNGIKYE